jgi:hypothetical protein
MKCTLVPEFGSIEQVAVQLISNCFIIKCKAKERIYRIVIEFGWHKNARISA